MEPDLYAYVILVRPSTEGAVAETLEVTHLLGDGPAERAAVNQALERMGEPPMHNTKADNMLVASISVLWLRARLNSAEGPFLIKSEAPIDADTMDQLVRNPEIMERLRKEARI